MGSLEEVEGQGVHAQVYSYSKPELKHSKAVVVLGRTDTAYVNVQVVRHGGENNLHSHPNKDGFWTVLRGRAKFYTTGDEAIADIGPMQGVVIPHGYPYWFESSGDEELEILQFEALSGIRADASEVPDRTDHEPVKSSYLTADHFDARSTGSGS